MATRQRERRSQPTLLLAGLAPLVALAALVALLLGLDPLSTLSTGAPPVEDVTVERVVVSSNPQGFVLTVVNGGPDPVTIAQVLVDDAYWPYEMQPGARLEPLSAARLEVRYPWVVSEPHRLVLLTSTGLTFEHSVDVTVPTSQLDWRLLGRLALVGLFVGLVPVGIGLLWHPFVRRLGQSAINVVLAFSAGVLLFLGVDASLEAIELAGAVPSAFDGAIAFATAAVVAFLVLLAGVTLVRRGAREAAAVATATALGIGLHNLGEGLAISAAWSTGQVALTTLLIVGFAMHNSTEGLAIVAPLAEQRPPIRQFVWLGLLAGAPTIAGTWLGALTYSPTLAVLFLGLGVGAIAQVVWELARFIARRGGARDPAALIAIAAGVLMMYGTGVLVAA